MISKLSISLAVIPSSIARYSADEVIEIIVLFAFSPEPCSIVRSEYCRLPSNPKISNPSVKSVIISATDKVFPPSPERKTIVSEPLPVVRLSAPVPPSSVSFPLLPTRISFPAFPNNLSSPVENCVYFGFGHKLKGSLSSAGI